MHARKVTCLITIIGFMLVFFPEASMADGSFVKGTLGIYVENETFLPGDMVSVFLVSERIDIPEITNMATLEKFKRIERLNSAHLDFFSNFREKRTKTGFIVAHTVSTPQGSFKFEDVKLGSYYVLVTFPSMIGGRKVAWQVPVEMITHRYIYIILRNENLALPLVIR